MDDWNGDTIAIQDIDDFFIKMFSLIFVEWDWRIILMEKIILLIFNLLICHLMSIVFSVL